MARTVNEKEYEFKRNEILDEAQRLVATKGYELMSIQEIIDRVKISKGAFYHYFGSKQELLEALADRIRKRVEQTIRPIVLDPNLKALEKLNKFFVKVNEWKSGQKKFMLSLIRVWYQDNNAVIRQKVRAGSIESLSPLVADVVRQGVQEGVFSLTYPDQTGEVVLVLIQDFNDSIARILLTPNMQENDVEKIEKTVDAYADAIERILDAPTGTLQIASVNELMEWMRLQESEIQKQK